MKHGRQWPWCVFTVPRWRSIAYGNSSGAHSWQAYNSNNRVSTVNTSELVVSAERKSHHLDIKYTYRRMYIASQQEYRYTDNVKQGAKVYDSAAAALAPRPVGMCILDATSNTASP